MKKGVYEIVMGVVFVCAIMFFVSFLPGVGHRTGESVVTQSDSLQSRVEVLEQQVAEMQSRAVLLPPNFDDKILILMPK